MSANKKRVKRAQAAFREFVKASGREYQGPDNDFDTIMADLIADLAHLHKSIPVKVRKGKYKLDSMARGTDSTFEDILRRAIGNYKAEI